MKDEIKERLAYARAQINYENSEGVHTYHACDCGRKICRMVKCVLCWEEDIKRLEKKNDRQNI